MSAETIVQYLSRMRDKDNIKHGFNGGRTTREVAEFYDISLATARRHLTKLSDAGEIEVLQSVCESGSPLLWRVP